MIRFVDLRSSCIGYRFAFWDTVTDRFCAFVGEQAWGTAEEFIADAKRAGVVASVGRYVRLIPKEFYAKGEEIE